MLLYDFVVKHIF